MSIDETHGAGYAVEARRTLWQRIRSRLFPMEMPPYRDHSKGWTAVTVTVKLLVAVVEPSLTM